MTQQASGGLPPATGRGTGPVTRPDTSVPIQKDKQRSTLPLLFISPTADFPFYLINQNILTIYLASGKG